MNKLFKIIAPLILSIFFCAAVVGLGWGEENKDQNLIFLSVNQPNDYAAGGGFGYEWSVEQHRIGVEWTNTGQNSNNDYLYMYGLYLKQKIDDDLYYSYGIGGATYNNKDYKRIEASGAVTGFIEAENYRGSLYLSFSVGQNVNIFNQLFAGEIEGVILNRESLFMIRIKYLFPDFLFAR